MTLARVPKRLSDYRIALETGVLTPIYMPVRTMQLNPDRSKIRKPKRSKEITVIEYESVTEAPKEEIPVVEKKRMISLPKSKGQVIFFTMLFVAIGSACMSIYHASAFLIQGGKPFIIASMTALLLVHFASTGFTAARYFSEQKGLAKIFSIPFILITSILICYIAFSTTSVSYEQFRDEEAGKTATVQKQIGSLELYSEVQKSITEAEKYIRSLEKLNTENITKQAFARHQKMLSSERDKLQRLREKSFELKEKSGGGSIADKKQSITSVYEFLTEIFGINSRILRFIIYVIPAVFYDIVAPFGFTVVFFLADVKIKEEEDEA
jgi:phage-related protein